MWSWSTSRPMRSSGRCWRGEPRRRARLLARLRRPTRVDLRAGGVGAAVRLRVVCAGKGTKHLPAYHEVTPENVWEHYGLPPEKTADLNARCSLVPRRHEVGGRDGRGRECHGSRAASARPRLPGLRHRDLAARLRPAADGGLLDRSGTSKSSRACTARDAGDRRPALGRVRDDHRRRIATSPARSRPMASPRPATAASPRCGGRRIWSGSSSASAWRERRWRASRRVSRGRRSPRSHAAPNATSVSVRRSTARAEITFMAFCRPSRWIRRRFRWGSRAARGSCATSRAATR